MRSADPGRRNSKTAERKSIGAAFWPPLLILVILVRIFLKPLADEWQLCFLLPMHLGKMTYFPGNIKRGA